MVSSSTNPIITIASEPQGEREPEKEVDPLEMKDKPRPLRYNSGLMTSDPDVMEGRFLHFVQQMLNEIGSGALIITNFKTCVDWNLKWEPDFDFVGKQYKMTFLDY